MNRRIFLIFSFAIVNLSSTEFYFKSTEQLKLSIFSIIKHDAKLSSISNPKTINGYPVKLGEIPYHALIFLTFENSPENTFYCSGSIIIENWIITAAKCTFNVRNVTIYLGVIDRLHGSTLWNVAVYKTSILTHEKYRPNQNFNDIGLFKTPKIPMSSYVAAVSIPKNYLDVTLKKGSISGWGSKQNLGQFLQTANVSITLSATCIIIFMEFMNIVCIIYVCFLWMMNLFCNGDVGSPLMSKINGIEHLVGIFIYGVQNACSLGSPVVVTKISMFLEWIKLHTKI